MLKFFYLFCLKSLSILTLLLKSSFCLFQDVIILDGLTELALPILNDYKKLKSKPRVEISSVQNSNDLKYFMASILRGLKSRILALHVTSARGNYIFSKVF